MTRPNDQPSSTLDKILREHRLVCDLCLTNRACPRASQLVLETLRIQRDASVQDQPLEPNPEIDMPPENVVQLPVANLDWQTPTKQPWWRKLLWELRGRYVGPRA